MTLPSEKLNRRGQDPSFILSLGGHAEEAAVVTAMRVLGSASCSRNAHRQQPPIIVRFLDASLHQSTGRNQDAKRHSRFGSLPRKWQIGITSSDSSLECAIGASQLAHLAQALTSQK
jgi:hypothetical protein